MIGFFSSQKIAAEKCEGLKEINNLVKLELKVYQKFKNRIDSAAKVRSRYYIRIYRKRWLDEILKVNEAFKYLIARNFKATVGLCSRLPGEFVRQIAEGWAYLSGKVDIAYHRALANPAVSICKSA